MDAGLNVVPAAGNITASPALHPGRLKLPRSIDGFTFTTLRAREPQTYRERGRKATTTIRFDYRVPNG